MSGQRKKIYTFTHTLIHKIRMESSIGKKEPFFALSRCCCCCFHRHRKGLENGGTVANENENKKLMEVNENSVERYHGQKFEMN